METNETITVSQASEALASARRSRSRVALGGYPWWYWLLTGACLGAVSYELFLPGYWVFAAAVPAAVVLVFVDRAACRARGVCEGWVRSSRTIGEAAILYGPSAVLIVADSLVAGHEPWLQIAAAVVIFVQFTVAGLVLSARAARS